ncbi:hypothetical protein EDC27_1483 [Desulfosoma caldarium]|uniref:Uncharacterized protein n=1 Tax=Desulfosoma caldarium TaxID=610254 RepID=A0A3N1UQT3_9BACT|nr:hypothetical protein EDC27_1483 [Desulfosoma caldarium]
MQQSLLRQLSLLLLSGGAQVGEPFVFRVRRR